MWVSGAAVWSGVVLRNAGVRRGADTGMDRHAKGVLPGCAVYRTGWDGGLGWTGCNFEVGLSAFARGARGGGGEFRREPGRSVSSGGDPRFGSARRIDVHGASGDHGGVYREHDSDDE